MRADLKQSRLDKRPLQATVDGKPNDKACFLKIGSMLNSSESECRHST
jgi:hypothetical protein